METIEEKIKQECVVTNSRPSYVLFDDAVRFATEQDSIARKEERERCVQRAQLCECKRCKDNDKCWLCDDCTIMQDVRKAIEEGGCT